MLLDLIIPLFSFRWPWLLMSSNSSWSASLFLFAVVALFRPESPAFAVVIRVRRSSNLYQYKSNRSASFKPQPPFIYINVCVYVCASADLMFFCAFCLWLSLLCAIYTTIPTPWRHCICLSQLQHLPSVMVAPRPNSAAPNCRRYHHHHRHLHWSRFNDFSVYISVYREHFATDLFRPRAQPTYKPSIHTLHHEDPNHPTISEPLKHSNQRRAPSTPCLAAI